MHTEHEHFNSSLEEKYASTGQSSNRRRYLRIPGFLLQFLGARVAEEE